MKLFQFQPVSARAGGGGAGRRGVNLAIQAGRAAFARRLQPRRLRGNCDDDVQDGKRAPINILPRRRSQSLGFGFTAFTK